MNALSPALRRKLSVLLSLGDQLAFAVYDRRGRIHFASPWLLQSAGLTAKFLKRNKFRTLFNSATGTPPRLLTDFLEWQAGRTRLAIDAVLIRRRPVDKPELHVTAEEKGGMHVTLLVRELDSSNLLCIIKEKPLNITRHMGMLSTDLLVCMDRRHRIMALTESTVNLSGFPSTRFFNTPIENLFLPGMFDQAIRTQKRLRKQMIACEASNRAPWEAIYRTAFSVADMDRDWLVAGSTRRPGRGPGLRITGGVSGTATLLLNKPLLLPDHDYRWDITLAGAGQKLVSVFFNGWKDPGSREFHAPENDGYHAGFYQDSASPKFSLRIKRKGFLLTGRGPEVCVPADPIRLAVEKSGGVFRMFINGRQRFRYADPLYRGYSEHAYTGIVLSSMPIHLLEAVLYSRKSVVPFEESAAADLRLRVRPEEIFETRFSERKSASNEVNGRELVTDVFLRNVTELRRTQKANRELLEQKSRALRQLNDELALAADVLNGLLPKSFPEIQGFRFHSYFKPSGHVGGDLFDVFQADADRLAILMYDVSGHGVPAALISVMTRTLFQKHYHPGATVLELLDRVNRDLFRDMPGRGFVTLFFGLLDHRKRELRYAGAGFTTPIAVSGDSLMLLNTRGIPLGIQEKITSSEYAMTFSGSSKLLLFTDGLYEIFNDRDEFYGPKRMVEFIRSHAALPVSGLMDAVLREHRRFAGNTEQKDDISLLGLEIDAP